MTASALRTEGPTDRAAAGYAFGDGAAAGVWLGLGAARLGVLTAGLLTGVGVLSAGGPLAVAALLTLTGAVGALVPVAGRPCMGWLPVLAARLAGTVTASHRWAPDTPSIALDVAGSTRPGSGSPRPLRLPREFGRVELVTAGDGGDDAVGVLVDRSAGTVTVVLEVAGVDRYPLLEPTDQDLLLAGWGAALTSLGQDRDLRRLQLLDRTQPTGARPLAPASDTLGEVEAELARLSVRRDSLLALQLDLDAVGAGPARRPRELDAAAVLNRCQHWAATLLGAQLAARPLPLAEIGPLLDSLLTAGDVAAPTGPALHGPVSRRAAWDHVRLDDSWHRTFAVVGWPRTAVPGDWLAPLLLTGAQLNRTVAIHLVPIPAVDASRVARSARTRAELDRADRHRLGLAPSAAADLSAEGTAGLDADLVAGHSAVRLAAVLGCAADSQTGLADASRQLLQAAAAARLELRPLHGQHHLGVAATLPLCRARTGGAL